jgi:hypothetical protein
MLNVPLAMNKTFPRGSAVSTDRLLATDDILARGVEDDEDEEEEEDKKDKKEQEDDSEDEADGYSELNVPQRLRREPDQRRHFPAGCCSLLLLLSQLLTRQPTPATRPRFE